MDVMTRVPPPLYLAGGLLAQHLLARSARRSGAARVAAGGLLAAGAVGLQASAMATFRRHHTTVNPISPEKATAVVDDGPFAVTRNPMYVAMAALLAAHALVRGGLAPWLPVAGFVALMDRTQIAAEERAMRGNFGPAYDDYAARVPRWLALPH